MFKLPSHWLFYLLALMVVSTVGVLYDHYSDAYSLRIYGPNESWLHDLPWQYEDLYGEAAEHMQESLSYQRGQAVVVSMSQTLGLFNSTDRAPYEAGFESALKQRTSSVSSCKSVETDTDRWNCLEWYMTIEDVSIRNRSYLSGRGITKVVVIFSANDDNFYKFGSTDRWLRELIEWEGPDIFKAL